MAKKPWNQVAKEADLEDGVPIGVKVERKDVLVVRLGEQLCACGNKCTHYGAPLSDGLLTGKVITCPWHSARFDVTTGKALAAPALDDLPTFPVKVEEGELAVGPAQAPQATTIAAGGKQTIAIVGAGAAGNAAAETLRREGFSGRILLITAEPDRPYDRPNLSKDFLAGEAKPEWIPLRSEEFYAQQQIELLTNHRVAALDPGRRTLTFAGGQQLQYDQVLLATGGSPRTLDVPGAALEGSFVLRSLANSKAILAAAEQAKSAVVVGASFIGMEVAAALRQRKIEVHVVAHDSVPMARVFGERIGRFVQSVHQGKGVLFHMGTTPAQIVGHGKVEAVALSDGTRIAADLVIAGVGIQPAVGFLQDTGLVEGGAIPVDGRLATKAPGVFAAGDIAIVPGHRTGEPQRVEHWVVAERQGQHAARALLGRATAYAEVPFFWTKQYDTSIKYIGFARSYDQIVYRGNVEQSRFVAGYYQGGALKAVAGCGMTREILALGEVLRAGKALSPEQLEDDGFDLFSFLGPQ